MDTLTISQTLQAAGFKQEQADAVAKVVDEKNQELITKEHLDAKLLATSEKLFNRLMLAMLTIAGISLTVVKLFFLE